MLAGEHTFEVRARIGSTYASTARTSWRIEFEAPAPGPAPAAAPAPATRATPALDGEMTLVSDATEFLYSGPDPIQKGVAADAVKPLQAAVLRGRVTRRNASPIEGVQVTVLDHPELGRTATRTDGGFDIAVNGGGTVTLVFERAGYIPSQRQLEVPTQDYEGVEEIVMVPYEDRVTGVDLSGDELQVAKGSTITDADGTRTATLLLEPGTDATATLPDGTTKPLGDKLNVRATEFTIGDSGPDAMPGELPPTSAYTYAVEYSIDEANAQGAVDVSFTKPVVTYIDNLIGFPAGTAVPMGYYDREQAQWVPSSNGVVIKLLSEADGRAVLDVTGTGIAATAAQLAALGIDDDELRKLAELYDPGKSLWRAAITHFTPWDYNWPYGLPDGAGGPGQGGPDDGDPDGDGRCNEGGSVIHCEDQTLGEQSVIAGTPYTLVYQSDRVPGRRTGDTLQIPLTGATLPPSVARVDLTISVLGPHVQAVVRPDREPLPDVHVRRDRCLRPPRPGPPEGRHPARLRLPRGLPHAGSVPDVVRGRRRGAAVDELDALGDLGRADVPRRRRRRPAGTDLRHGGLERRRPPHLRPGRPHALSRRRHQAQRRGPELRRDRDREVRARLAGGHDQGARRGDARRRRRGQRRTTDRARWGDDDRRRRARHRRLQRRRRQRHRRRARPSGRRRARPRRRDLHLRPGQQPGPPGRPRRQDPHDRGHR